MPTCCNFRDSTPSRTFQGRGSMRPIPVWVQNRLLPVIRQNNFATKSQKYSVRKSLGCSFAATSVFSVVALTSSARFVSSSPVTDSCPSAVSDKYVGAIRGGIVADAASMGLHWIYDTAKLKQLVDSSPSKDPAFFEPPSCPFYQSKTGQPSPTASKPPLHSHGGGRGRAGSAGAAWQRTQRRAMPARSRARVTGRQYASLSPAVQ